MIQSCSDFESLLVHFTHHSYLNRRRACFLQFEFLFQGCYCERLLTTGANNQSNGTKPGKDGDEKTVKFHCLALVDIRILQFCFGIMYRRENQRQYELRADTVSECKAWIDAIKMARWMRKLKIQKSIFPFWLTISWKLVNLYIFTAIHLTYILSSGIMWKWHQLTTWQSPF